MTEFQGAILAWSRFEEEVIRDIAELFPDLAERLIALVYRIVDLLQIVRDHVAHPFARVYRHRAFFHDHGVIDQLTADIARHRFDV